MASRKPSLRTLIAQLGKYGLRVGERIEPPPAELAPRLIEALPRLAKLLDSDDEEIRQQSLATLARVWQIAPEQVLPFLMAAIASLPVYYWTRVLTKSLAEKSPNGGAIVALLIGYLAHFDARAVSVAAGALASYGTAASEAVPALLTLLAKDRNHPEAALALWRAGRRTEALPGLIAATKRLSRDELLATIDSLAEIGPAAAEAAPALLELKARRRDLDAAIDGALQKLGSIKMRMPGNELIEVMPSDWPRKDLQSQPGDLRQFTSNLDSSQSQGRHPFLETQLTEARGGRFHFVDDRDYKKELRIILAALGVRQDWKKYAVFIGHASDPTREGYLTQLKIVTYFALYRLFDAIAGNEALVFPEQALMIGDLVCGFVEKQREEWNSLPQTKREHLGNYRVGVNEELGFGFMIEDVKYGVYRLWSRAWLNAGKPIEPFGKAASI